MTQRSDPEKTTPISREVEKVLHSYPKGFDSISPAEAKRLIQLMVLYRVEVEAQNEELRRSQLSAEELFHKYKELYEFAPVAYLTLDQAGVIIEANLAAEGLLGISRGFLIRTPLSAYLNSSSKVFFSHLQQVLDTKVKAECEVTLKRRDRSPFSAHLESSELVTSNGRVITMVIRDLTERKQAEKEREKLVLELKEALAQIKTLHGILSICSYCHKIQNDEGKWEQIELYIRDRSEAEFSHGICPECLAIQLSGLSLLDK